MKRGTPQGDRLAPNTVRSELGIERVDGRAPPLEDWRRLAEQSGNVFATWEWVSIWWRHFGNGRQFVPLACRSQNGRIVGIVPLYEFVRRPLTVVRFPGHGPGDILGPISAPADRDEVGRALRGVFSDRRWGWDLLLAERLCGDQGWGALLGGKLIYREANPVLQIGDMTWEDFLQSRSRNFREQFRRSERRMTRHYSCRIRPTREDSLEHDMNALFELHDARWTAKRSQAFAGPRRAFHLEWAAAALARGWLRFWLMEVDGKPVAAWYGFRFGDAEWYYQAGRDPAMERHSVGLLLLAHSVREAIQDGMKEYRFLRGDEDYKMRFANHDPGLETLAIGHSAAARVCIAAAASVPSLPSPLKRWLSDLMG